MKYLLCLLTLIMLCIESDAMAVRRHRGKEGFMGAPERRPKHSRKETGNAIAGVVIATAGNAVIDDLRHGRTHTAN